MAEVIYAGDAGAFKTCSCCDEAKTPSFFYSNSRGGDLGVDSICKECVNDKRNARRAMNPEKHLERNKAWREANLDKARALSIARYAKSPEKTLSAAKLRYAKDPERFRAEKAAYRAANPEAVRLSSSKSSAKKLSTAKGKLETAISGGVRRGLTKGSKAGRRAFDLVGYCVDDLRRHIEAQFEPWMTWENYAHDTWHIDHRRPLASFQYSTPDCPDFKLAWALSNLRPLEAKANMSKGARLDHLSQVSASAAH